MTAPIGWRVLVPRAEGSAGPMLQLLDAAGLVADAVPMIAIGPPDDPSLLDMAVRALAAGDYAWIGFASTHGVAAVFSRARALGIDVVVPAGTRVAGVGPATAAALRSNAVAVDLENERQPSAAGLAEIWPPPLDLSSRVLLPASAIGLPTLADALAARGYLVDRVSAYAPQPVPLPSAVASDLDAGRYAAVLLTAPSIVNALATAVELPTSVLVGCIGPTTAAAAVDAGLTVTFVAAEPTPHALVEGLVQARTGGISTR